MRANGERRAAPLILSVGGCGAGDHGSQRGNVTFERFAADIAEPNSDSTPSIGQRTLDRDVSGLLQNGELLGER